MGLFSNNKKLCPVCGEPTPRLLSTKIAGTPICKRCAGKVELPDGMINQMSVEVFTEYINFYDNNQSLRDIFGETYRYSGGFFGNDIVVDVSNRLFRLRNADHALVFEAFHLKGFRILEDGNILYESQGNALRCYKSDVPERIKGMYAVVEQFRVRRQQYEFMENMQKREEEAARQRGETYQKRYISQPFFEGNEPIHSFYIELDLEHPYWNEFRGEVKGPKFSSTHPEVDNYLCDYQNAVEKLHELALSLMQVICPGAQEIQDGNVQNQGADFTVNQASQGVPVGVDAVEEIKKYKELLDAGIITEEEFSMKKRQLLGI